MLLLMIYTFNLQAMLLYVFFVCKTGTGRMLAMVRNVTWQEGRYKHTGNRYV